MKKHLHYYCVESTKPKTMKKMSIAVIALVLGFTQMNAQTTKATSTAKPAVQAVTGPSTPAKSTAPAKAAAPAKATTPQKEVAPSKATKPAKAAAPSKAVAPAKSKLPAVSPAAKTKKDGTPNRGNRENQKLKKDGMPDKRFRDNKIPAQRTVKPAVKQEKAAPQK